MYVQLLFQNTQYALDDAGLTQESLSKNTAVYMGMSMGEMTISLGEQRNLINPYVLTGGGRAVAANRISFFYDLLGPSVGVDAGCSSALTCIHYGLLSLWNNECDTVIAGGANSVRCPHFHIIQCEMGCLSQRGEARPFDKSADGRIRSEGCGVIVMKPLRDAIRDGDHVHCIIHESVSGYHGNGLDLSLGSVETVSEVIMKLYKSGDVSPDQVDFIEASASGCPRDDVFEAEVISKVFKSKKKPIKVGSCKASIGHAENVSGMASFIKCTLMLKNREFYAQTNFSDINPNIPATKWKLDIQQEFEKYTEDRSMVVGINSIASTGQVCHMVLVEYKNDEPVLSPSNLSGWHFGVSRDSGRHIIVPLSAKTKSALKELAYQWHQYSNPNDDAQIVASWLALKRNHYSHRLVILANSGDDFRKKIQTFLDGSRNEAVMECAAPAYFHHPKLCLVFPGQGQQRQDMGRALYAKEPVYRIIVNRCDEIWKHESGYSFLERFKIFIPHDFGTGQPDVDDITICQIAVVVHQIALFSLIQHWGISPNMVIGHSLGEVAAAYVAGTMTLEECVVSIFHRTVTMTKMSGIGAMAASRLSPQESELFCSKYDNLYVACYNSPDSVTLSGDRDTIMRLAEQNPKMYKVIRVKAAFHTVMMRPTKEEYFDRMKDKYVPKVSKDVTIYSTVTRDVYPGPHGVEYWWASIEQPVFFVQAVEAIFRDHGSNVVFVEVTSTPTLLSCIRQTAKQLRINPDGFVTCGSRDADNWVAALKGLVQLYFMGFPVDWRNMTRNCARYVPTPQYPFCRTEYALESEIYHNRRLGKEDKSYKGRYGEIDLQMHSFLADCRFNDNAVMPAAGWIEFFMEMTDEKNQCIKDVRIFHTPKLFDVNVLGQYDKLYVEAVVKDDKVYLLANSQAWCISPEQSRGIYATAILAKAATTEYFPTKLSIGPIHSRCSVHLDKNKIYESLLHVGWQYGDSFKPIKEIRIGDKEAIGSLAPEINKYERIKTVTINGAFQIVQVSFADRAVSYELARIGQVNLTAGPLSLNQSFNVYVKLTNRSSKAFSVNVYITDTPGNVLAALLGCNFVIRHDSLRSPPSHGYYRKSERRHMINQGLNGSNPNPKTDDITMVCGERERGIRSYDLTHIIGHSETISLSEK